MNHPTGSLIMPLGLFRIFSNNREDIRNSRYTTSVKSIVSKLTPAANLPPAERCDHWRFILRRCQLHRRWTMTTISDCLQPTEKWWSMQQESLETVPLSLLYWRCEKTTKKFFSPANFRMFAHFSSNWGILPKNVNKVPRTNTRVLHYM